MSENVSIKIRGLLQSKITSTRKCFPLIPTAQKEYPASGRGLVKGHPWMIWVIIDNLKQNRSP